MGETRINIWVQGLANGHQTQSGPIECIVDTGATLTVLPESFLKKARIKPEGKIKVHLADGRIVQRRFGFAALTLEGVKVVVRVIFGEKQDPALLGLTALEDGSFVVDPIERKLIKKGYYQQY